MSLLIATIAGRFDRRYVLMALISNPRSPLQMLIAVAPNFLVLMAARALLGLVIGGFWSLATATVMRLVSVRVGSESVWGICIHRKRNRHGLRSRPLAATSAASSDGAACFGARAHCSGDADMAMDQSS